MDNTMMIVNPAGKKKNSKPRVNHQAKCAKAEQQLKTATRDMGRWQRRALRAEARFETLRHEQIHLLMTLVSNKDNFVVSTSAWLINLLNEHGQAFQSTLGAQVLSRSAQVKTPAEIEAHVLAQASSAGKSTEAIHGAVAEACKTQEKVLQEAWYADLKPVLRSFDDADRLLEDQQRLYFAWKADLEAARQLLPVLTDENERTKVSNLMRMCEKPLVILHAQITFLEQQH